jgi:glycosyltransferase involved in cell wall biosynthesis
MLTSLGAGRDRRPDLTVVVCTYNRARRLEGTLAALVAQEAPQLSWEVLVVDNNSRDNTREVVQTVASAGRIPVRYEFERQQGLSRARNRGVAQARGQIIAFTDDDVLPGPHWVRDSVDALERWRADGVGGRILPRWEEPPPSWLAVSPRLRLLLALMEWDVAQVLTSPIRGVPQIWGANMVFRRTVFDSIGGFDTRRGPVGSDLSRGEDTEFIERAVGHGLRMVYDPVLVVWHRVGRERLRKQYFRRWMFDTHTWDVYGTPPLGPLWAGVPRWHYRIVARDLFRWLAHTLLHRADSFDRELDLIAEFGRLREYRRATRGIARG